MSSALWEPVLLSASQRPVLGQQEVEMCSSRGVLVFGQEPSIPSNTKGILRISSHRIMWSLDTGLQCYGLSLEHVNSAEAKSTGWIRPTKLIQAYLRRISEPLRMEFTAAGDRDPCLRGLRSALAAREWEKHPLVARDGGDGKASPSVPPKPAKQFSPLQAGLGGIMRRMQEEVRQDDETMADAFSDLTALMAKADDMVKLARKCARSQRKSGEEESLDSTLMSIGIASPITKESAGSMFHTELARQLADFMEPLLMQRGGLMTLPDVYCVYNRARGTDLISPDDLYRACVAMPKLGLSLHLHTFVSGVIVLQTANVGESALLARIKAVIGSDGPQTAFSVSQQVSVSITLALELLQRGEEMGELCRDESYEGLVFYLNFFKDY